VLAYIREFSPHCAVSRTRRPEIASIIVVSMRRAGPGQRCLRRLHSVRHRADLDSRADQLSVGGYA